jgi:FixJ family two-component response regulator
MHHPALPRASCFSGLSPAEIRSLLVPRGDDGSPPLGWYSVMSALVAIVDDDDGLRHSLVDLMRSAGYRAESFASSELFVESNNLSRFHCVVADIHMPGKSGLELIPDLRKQGHTLPVILITALTDGTLDVDATLAGAQCLLRKPFKGEVLLVCVERSIADNRV